MFSIFLQLVNKMNISQFSLYPSLNYCRIVNLLNFHAHQNGGGDDESSPCCILPQQWFLLSLPLLQ